MAAIFYKWLMIGSWFMLPLMPHAEKISRHPFYIAVTEINLNTSDKTLEISCKMFADDLEKIIEKNNHTRFDISADKDQRKFESYIAAYVKNHLNVSIDGNVLNLSFLGFEKENESAYCYFQVENISALKKIDINNSLLHDLTSDQINIIHVIVNGKRQSIKLDYPNKTASFNF